MMRVGIASDHGGFALKEQLAKLLRGTGYNLTHFGAHQFNAADDYPDFIIPLAGAVAAGEVERGVVLCGSGVGASIAANKVPGARAGLIHDAFPARQGFEDDDINVFCLGGKVIGSALAWELIGTFLSAQFSGALRHRRRLAKVMALEPVSLTLKVSFDAAWSIQQEVRRLRAGNLLSCEHPALPANRPVNGKIAARRPQNCLGPENHDQGDS
jgi:ribose 5-phosphate isomerase B